MRTAILFTCLFIYSIPIFAAGRYDVLEYNISVDLTTILESTKLEPERRTFDGIAKIKICSQTDNLETIELNSVTLDVKSILINYSAYKGYVYSDNMDSLLIIPLPTPLNTGDTIQLEIKYIYNNLENIGFLHANTVSQTRNIDSIPYPIAFTTNEPDAARFWFPCNDVPNDKAKSGVTITVPYGYNTVSNGHIDSIAYKINGQDTLTAQYFWSDTNQIATYLIFFAASKYTHYVDWSKPTVDNPTDSIKLNYYIWAEDYNGKKYNAESAFSSTNDMMKLFSSLFGRYPFDEYGVVTVDFGLFNASSMGMENQTITAVSRGWIETSASHDYLFAHELGHHWFGDAVTCDSWNDIWFNEGAATWCQAIYLGRDNQNIYYSEMENIQNGFFNKLKDESLELKNMPIYGIDEDKLFDNPYSVFPYNKGAWVYHQLKEIVGDSLTFAVLEALLNEYKFRNITTAEFINYFISRVENPKVDLLTYFNQWLYQGGYPQYYLQLSSQEKQEDGTTKVTINLSQMQENEDVPNIFVLPIEFILYTANGQFYYCNAINDKRNQAFTFYLDSLVDIKKIEINKQKVFCTYETDQSSIHGEDISKVIITPNIISSDENIFINIQDGYIKSLEIFDISGRKMNINSYEWLDNSTQSACINLVNFLNGIYMLKINDHIIKQIIINR